MYGCLILSVFHSFFSFWSLFLGLGLCGIVLNNMVRTFYFWYSWCSILFFQTMWSRALQRFPIWKSNSMRPFPCTWKRRRSSRTKCGKSTLDRLDSFAVNFLYYFWFLIVKSLQSCHVILPLSSCSLTLSLSLSLSDSLSIPLFSGQVPPSDNNRHARITEVSEGGRSENGDRGAKYWSRIVWRSVDFLSDQVHFSGTRNGNSQFQILTSPFSPLYLCLVVVFLANHACSKHQKLKSRYFLMFDSIILVLLNLMISSWTAPFSLWLMISEWLLTC